MARIVSFMICDTVNNIPAPTNDGIIQTLVAPQIAVRPQFVPGNFSFGIAVGVSGIDLKKENSVRFTIADPDGKVIQNSGSSTLPAVSDKDTLPEDYQGFILSMDIRNLTIEKEGCYLFRIFINDEEIGEREIPVYKRGK